MTEILFDLRRNAALAASKALIAALLLVSMYNVLSFSASTQSAINAQFGEAHDRNLFSITDSVTDSAEFEQARQDPVAVGRIGEFYNSLNASESYELLSTFDQPVPVSNFAGGDEFDAWKQFDPEAGGEYLDPQTGDPTRDVLSMQINQKAFDFYGLSVAQGDGFPWSDINYSEGHVPVLLGSSYEGVYAIGDELAGNFYSKPITMRVAGFLAPNSSIFFKNESGFYLDDYVVMPYPPTLDQPEPDDLMFAGILAFAMINSDIAAPRSMSTDEVLASVQSAAQRAGFDKYAFIDVPQYLTQYSLTRDLLRDNERLVFILMASLALSALLVMYVLARTLAGRRSVPLRVRWALGVPRPRLAGSLAAMTLVDWTLSAILFGALYASLVSTGSPHLKAVVGCLIVFALLDIFQSLAVSQSEPHGGMSR